MENVFYFLSKAIWLLISPDTLLILLSALGCFFLLRNKMAAAKYCFLSLTTVLCLIATLPIGQWLLIPLEQRFPNNPPLPEQVDGIIVLSGAEWALLSDHWQQPNFSDAAERDMAFMVLARRYPNAKLVFTGGGAFGDRQLTEAGVAKQLFHDQGLDTDKILFETKARNTAENAAFSKALVKPATGEQWILITSAFHMPRSLGLFCAQQWPTIPYPVDHRTLPGAEFTLTWRFTYHLELLNLAVKEWVGLTAYYWFGKTHQWLPDRCG